MVAGFQSGIFFLTDSGYPLDAGLPWWTTLTNPGNVLRFNTQGSSPTVSSFAHSRGPGARQAEEVQVTSLTYPTIETRMDRPKAVSRVIKGVA